MTRSRLALYRPTSSDRTEQDPRVRLAWTAVISFLLCATTLGLFLLCAPAELFRAPRRLRAAGGCKADGARPGEVGRAAEAAAAAADVERGACAAASGIARRRGGGIARGSVGGKAAVGALSLLLGRRRRRERALRPVISIQGPSFLQRASSGSAAGRLRVGCSSACKAVTRGPATARLRWLRISRRCVVRRERVRL